MIKGLFIPFEPKLEKVTLFDVVSELDPLSYSEEDSASYKSIESKLFYTKRYTVKSYSSEDLKSIMGLFDVYNVIGEARPGFLKALQYTQDTILIALPKFDNFFEETDFLEILTELTRVSTFLLKTTDTEEEAVELMKDYMDTFIVVGKE